MLNVEEIINKYIDERTRMGISKYAVQKRTGITYTHLSYIEKTKSCSLNTLIKLLDVIGYKLELRRCGETNLS